MHTIRFFLCSLLGLFFLSFLSTPSLGQSAESPRYTPSAQAGFRVGPDQMGGSVSLWGHRGFGDAKRFQLGFGLRYTGNQANHTDYITAPAKFTSDETKLDTLHVESGLIHSVNLAVDFRYRVVKRFSLGFNIDLVGASFGSKINPKLRSSLGSFSPEAKPTAGNFLLVGDNDIGSLNSELYVHFSPKETWAIRAGLSYLFTEYQTDKSYIPGIDNDRYRSKNMGFFLGFHYPF
jgi:long-subunit fatty acid transport protein